MPPKTGTCEIHHSAVVKISSMLESQQRLDVPHLNHIPPIMFIHNRRDCSPTAELAVEIDMKVCNGALLGSVDLWR